VIRALLDARVNADLRNKAGSSALMVAAAQGQDDAVRLVPAAGADPGLVNTDHRTARDLATLASESAIVALLAR
jgi:ankyrin repeat protein